MLCVINIIMGLTLLQDPALVEFYLKWSPTVDRRVTAKLQTYNTSHLQIRGWVSGAQCNLWSKASSNGFVRRP